MDATQPTLAILGSDGAPHLVPLDEPVLRADEHSATHGDGVFETMHVRGGEVWLRDAHLDRMFRSASKLGLELPAREQLEAVISTAVDAWRERGAAEAGVKLMCSRGSEYAPELGPTVWSMAFGISPTLIRKRREGIAAVSLSFGYSTAERERSPWLLGGAKTLSYAVNMAAIRYAVETGFDDVLLTSSDGYVLEGPTSSVVWAVGETLFTVPHYTGILPSTTVGYLTENAHTLGLRTEDRMITVDELTQADAVWLCSSVRGIIEVTSLDGGKLGRSPLHRDLARLLGFPNNAE